MENSTQVVKKKKFLSKIPHFFKTRLFAFLVTVVLFAISGIMLLALDVQNMVRPKSPFFDGIRSVFLAMGMGHFNVTIWSWFSLLVFFGTVFFILFCTLFAKKYVVSRNNHHLKKKGVDYSGFRKFLIGSSLVILVAGILVTVLTVFWFYMPSNWKASFLSSKFTGETVVNTIISIAICILFALIIPVTLGIVYLIFLMIVKILSVILGVISRNIMASQSYQEAKAATDAVSERIREEAKELAKAAKEANASVNNGNVNVAITNSQKLAAESDCLFPALTTIDRKWESLGNTTTIEELENPSESVLEEKVSSFDYDAFKNFAYEFQAYLCSNKLYFDINIIRSFIAGLGSARLILLEGLSGTGKSTLPRYFENYIGGKANFFPVQATWRDRTDITGYYSDLTGEYRETGLLKALYEASYTPNNVNLMVLDEMNISRVEYYFADFLSIFEYPKEEWLVNLMQLKPTDVAPNNLVNGAIKIPENTWFVGTVNIDDSTFTITDKVYDRAIVIDFNKLNTPFTSDYNPEVKNITLNELMANINLAKSLEDNNLDEAETEKFIELCNFVSDVFYIKFGNRIMNQVNNFLPTFVALGGTKEEALDIMFATKILRKLDGRFETYIKDGLVKLSRYLNQSYGKNVFKETEATIEKYRKKLS